MGTSSRAGLGVADRDETAFDLRVVELERAGDLLRQPQGTSFASPPSSTSSPARCRAIPTASASSFPTTAATTCSSHRSEMHKVLHGDRATARRIGIDRRGRPEGEIVDVLARANRDVVGRLHEERGICVRRRREPADQPGPADSAGRARQRAKPGEVVVVEIVEQPSRASRGASRASIEVLGSYTDPGMEIEIALRKHDLPHRVLGRARERQANGLPDGGARPPIARDASTSPRCRSSRSTARRRRTSTTPSTASATATGFRLIVAIADVSHYVRDGDALDATRASAARRSTFRAA